jgi:hypothetical protein
MRLTKRVKSANVRNTGEKARINPYLFDSRFVKINNKVTVLLPNEAHQVVRTAFRLT